MGIAAIDSRKGEGALGEKIERRARFLSAILDKAKPWHPLFFTMSRTGIRLGEAIGLRWSDLDFTTQKVRVARNVQLGRV